MRSEIEVEAERKRRKRRRFRLMLVATAAVMGLEALLCLLLAVRAPTLLPRFFPFITAGGLWAVILIPNFVVWLAMGSEPMSGESRADELRRGLIRVFTWLPAMVALMAYPLFRDSLGLIDGSLGATRYSSGSVVFAFLAMMVSFAGALSGSGLLPRYRGAADDRLFRDRRAASIRTGFFGAIAGMTVAYLVGLYDPARGIAALPILCGAAVATAGGHFVFLGWKAGSNG